MQLTKDEIGEALFALRQMRNKKERELDKGKAHVSVLDAIADRLERIDSAIDKLNAMKETAPESVDG